MKTYDTDLHIHSPHSIAVSKNLNLDTMVITCKKKGLNILGTGDITQPDWRKYLETNLECKNGIYSYKGTYFIIQTELEDNDSVHHVVLLPNIKAGEMLQNKLAPLTKDITSDWAGRPHIHASPAEIVEIVDEVGGISGPAHAFTPFKAIFRATKYRNLEECYGNAAKKVYFIELGLSADTDLADRMECLKDVTFLSNSDAHSEGPQSLGREFNRFMIEEPSFDEIYKAIRRQDGRHVSLNFGLEPRLGKYPMIFCKNCRHRIQLNLGIDVKPEIDALPKIKNISESYAIDDQFIYYFFNSVQDIQTFKSKISKGKILCENCARQTKPKKSKLVLGVFDRVDEISDYKEPKHPSHRPEYIDSVPLVEMLRVIKNVKSVTARSVINEYEKLVKNFGNEFKILTDENVLPDLRSAGYDKLANLINAFRKKTIDFIPGGGGKYGEIQFDAL